jgi:hypothetical protein
VTATVSTAFDRLAEPVKRWIWQQGWTELRDVQERAIPAVLDGGDVIAGMGTCRRTRGNARGTVLLE